MASILLIIFQFVTTGFVPWMKYALETLMVLFIAPIRVKKKIKMKDGKLTLETVEETATKETAVEEVNEASSQPVEQP